ncbi:MAG: HEAT repeat domain-containing protein [Planctomycetota bacterium]|nr:MAG: HEAT repeat domain-containing protein [Planctomycetota bacterium]
MDRFPLFTLLALPTFFGPGIEAPLPAPKIEWQNDYAAAFQKAEAENKVVFLAVNMEGEAANDWLAEKLYRDKEIIQYSQHTINLIACTFPEENPEQKCSRFPGLTFGEVHEVDIQARKQVLKASADGQVIAPQHVFLDGQGKVLLSVPYLIGKDELIWCFVTAIHQLDPDSALKVPNSARPPKRLIMGDVFDPGQWGVDTRPLSEEELEATIKQLKGGLKGQERIDAFYRILTTQSPKAVDFVTKELKGRGFARAQERKMQAIDTIGKLSPPMFWECLEGGLMDGVTEVRNHTVVALEQLGSPDSVKALRKFFKKEKDPSVKKNFLRALGSAGSQDKSTRSLLLKAASSDKDPTLRNNAVLALAHHSGDAKVRAHLQACLEAEDLSLRQAAACAIAWSRDEDLAAGLRKAAENQEDGPWAESLQSCLEVLDGGNLAKIQSLVTDCCRDSIPRERFFGPVLGTVSR